MGSKEDKILTSLCRSNEFCQLFYRRSWKRSKKKEEEWKKKKEKKERRKSSRAVNCGRCRCHAIRAKREDELGVKFAEDRNHPVRFALSTDVKSPKVCSGRKRERLEEEKNFFSSEKEKGRLKRRKKERLKKWLKKERERESDWKEERQEEYESEREERKRDRKEERVWRERERSVRREKEKILQRLRRFCR